MGWLYTIRLITEYENKKIYKFGKTICSFWKSDKTINLSFVEDTNIEDKILIELKKDTHLNFISDFGFEWFNCEDEEYLYKNYSNTYI